MASLKMAFCNLYRRRATGGGETIARRVPGGWAKPSGKRQLTAAKDNHRSGDRVKARATSCICSTALRRVRKPHKAPLD